MGQEEGSIMKLSGLVNNLLNRKRSSFMSFYRQNVMGWEEGSIMKRSGFDNNLRNRKRSSFMSSLQAECDGAGRGFKNEEKWV